MILMEEWEAKPLHEKLRALPDRHSYTMKCLIWQFMALDRFDSALLERIANAMGYERAPAVEQDLGGGMVLTTGITYVLREVVE